MNINAFVKTLGDACYGFLAINFLWGLYCVILQLRLLGELQFRKEHDQQQFLGDLEQMLKRGDYDAAVEVCREESQALPNLAVTAITNRNMGTDQLRELLADSMHRDVLSTLEFRMSWIATVIKSGPLLGLFGTVLGMMAAFGRIGTGEKVQPHQIAHEISVALICTAMGLATAIPFSYFLASINIRVRMLQESLGSGLSFLLECLRPTNSQESRR
jgi:biopolymer transport protein ExbB